MPELVIEQPDSPVRRIPLTESEITLGRGADNDVVLRADEVSRRHAKIFSRGSQSVIVDLKSLNGTFVNNQRIVERVLSDGDEIWLGGKCRVLYADNSVDRVTPAQGGETPGSAVQDDLKRIRAKMNRAANHLTMLGSRDKQGVEDIEAEASPEELVDMSRAYRRLEALYRAGKLIASEFDLSRRLAAVLDTAVEVLEADRGFIMMRNEDDSSIHVSVARGMGKELESGAPSMGIARRAAIDGEPVLMADAEFDEQFGMRDSIIRQNILSAMCVPLQVEDRILGSIYVDSRKSRVAFDQADLELFASLASQSAMAIDNARLHEQMLEAERKRTNLGRFLSPAIVDVIMKEESTLALGGSKRDVTSLFCDIRGFTPLTEQMPATQIVDVLNEHFSAMTEIVFEYRGTLDKYIGDEVMAVFGAPLSDDDDAERAVRAAIAMIRRNKELNEQRSQQGRPELSLGIGIDTGEVIAGFVGSPMRMEFTVVGDHVNTARRLCDIAQAGQIVIAEPTYELVRDIVKVQSIGRVTLEGKQIPTNAYEVLEDIREETG